MKPKIVRLKPHGAPLSQIYEIVEVCGSKSQGKTNLALDCLTARKSKVPCLFCDFEHSLKSKESKKCQKKS